MKIFGIQIGGSSDEVEPYVATPEEWEQVQETDDLLATTNGNSSEEELESLYQAENALAEKGIVKGPNGWVQSDRYRK